MPWSALPEHLNSPEKWEGTDWDVWYQRWLLKYKGWFAYGPRSKQWWARWRPVPKTLIQFNCKRKMNLKGLTYHSIIQYWTRWSFILQWPFHIAFHWYWPWAKVPKEPKRPGDFTIKEMVYIRFGARFDYDSVYWAPSLFIGGDFN